MSPRVDLHIAVFRDLYAEVHLVVAVGTTIADRPPHRSVRARLRIRLLLRMSGEEPLTGMGMQDAGQNG
jgi:hypothetical protein